MATYRLENLDCPVCAAKIEDSLKTKDFVRSVSIDFGTLSMKIDADNMDAVTSEILRMEPSVRIVSTAKSRSANENADDTNDTEKATKQVHFGSYTLPLRRVLIFVAAAILWVLGIALKLLDIPTAYRYMPLIPFTIAYVLAGAPVLQAAVRNLIRGKALDENFLMSLATVGAFAVGEWEEAVGVMIFYMIGELAQEAAVLRSRRSIDALLALKPDRARVLEGKGWNIRLSDEVPVDSIILVHPGERVPLDGIVVEGSGFVDASALTGESLPIRVDPGYGARSGTTILDTALKIRTTKVAGESSAARIVELVENAAHAKTKTERFITTFARWYTPAVVGAAILIALIPPLLITGAHFSDWLYRALIMLVISCPCALVVSIPLGYFGGIGGLSRRGILVKGSSYLDSLAKARRVVFDKTGTLTEGRFSILSVKCAEGTELDQVIRLAAGAEAQSNHPLAKAIVSAMEGKTIEAARGFREIAGKGVEATIEDQRVLVGNERLLSESGIMIPEIVVEKEIAAATSVLVAVDGKYIGRIFVGDAVKPTAAAAIKRLDSLGVKETVMLTGDAENTAAVVSQNLGIDSYYARLLPEDKLEILQKLSIERESTGKSGRTIFVGDGINDAPVLARADVGIAMGSGADVAVEAADVVIMTDDPDRVGEAIERARKTRRIVMQNVVFALAFKAIFLALGASGYANMWEAVIADVGVALIAVLNSTRALK